MRWLKHTVSLLLLVAAVAVTLGTVFSNHSDDYGKVPLPQGGVVHLPQGKVVVFYRQAGGGADGGPAAPLTFQVTRVADGAPVPVSADNGATIANADQRSETIGELGAVAKLDVPSAGSYVVSAERCSRARDLLAGVRNQCRLSARKALAPACGSARRRDPGRPDPGAAFQAALGGRVRAR